MLPLIHTSLLDFLNSHGYQVAPGDGHERKLYIHAYNRLESCSVAVADLLKLLKTVTVEHGVPPSIIAH
jgi:hypothetical protein